MYIVSRCTAADSFLKFNNCCVHSVFNTFTCWHTLLLCFILGFLIYLLHAYITYYSVELLHKIKIPLCVLNYLSAKTFYPLRSWIKLCHFKNGACKLLHICISYIFQYLPWPNLVTPYTVYHVCFLFKTVHVYQHIWAVCTLLLARQIKRSYWYN